MKRLLFPIVLTLVLVPFVACAETIEEKAQICAACHGKKGVPQEQPFAVPIIWGQQFGYLYFQLCDFKSGVRKNDQMTPIVESLDRGELAELARYFAKQPWPEPQQPNASHDVAGQTRHADKAAVCTGCHKQGFVGDGSQPRLAGQSQAYLEKTMKDFRSGARGNNPGMTDLMKVPEPDIAALAEYLAGL